MLNEKVISLFFLTGMEFPVLIDQNGGLQQFKPQNEAMRQQQLRDLTTEISCWTERRSQYHH